MTLRRVVGEAQYREYVRTVLCKPGFSHAGPSRREGRHELGLAVTFM